MGCLPGYEGSIFQPTALKFISRYKSSMSRGKLGLVKGMIWSLEGQIVEISFL